MYGSPIFVGDYASPTIKHVQINPDESIYLYYNSYLPIVGQSYNGSELIVKNGVWSVQQKKFVVTLTPTAEDYSGVMDKTVAEINAAYEAGQQIVFRTMTSETTYMDVDCTARWFDGSTYPSFNGFILSDSVFIFAFTATTNDGTKQTYGTSLYALTPAS